MLQKAWSVLASLVAGRKSYCEMFSPTRRFRMGPPIRHLVQAADFTVRYRCICAPPPMACPWVNVQNMEVKPH